MLALADHETSRFPSKERAHMPVSKDHAGPSLALSRPSVLPSVTGTTSAPRDEGTFAAQWLAYALPCQRFANTLTGIGA
jgi:hypothetical protein